MAKLGKASKPELSPSGKIIGGLSGPLSEAIQTQILNPDASNALTEREIQGATQAVRSGYGARGLAGSGIAQAGETQAQQDILLKAGQQQAQNIIGVLGAGSGAPSYAPQATPRGFMGLK
jgi:hypothetical protein